MSSVFFIFVFDVSMETFYSRWLRKRATVSIYLACVPFFISFCLLQPGSILVADALTKRSDFDVLVHNGDISYATGFLVEWDSFLELITPLASKVSYMTTIGNHER